MNQEEARRRGRIGGALSADRARVLRELRSGELWLGDALDHPLVQSLTIESVLSNVPWHRPINRPARTPRPHDRLLLKRVDVDPGWIVAFLNVRQKSQLARVPYGQFTEEHDG